MEFTLLGAAALGVATTYLMLRFVVARRFPEALDLMDPVYGAIGAGILVGRLTAMIAAGTMPWLIPADILIVRGGVSTVGASIGALATWLLLVRSNFRMQSDLVAPAALVGLAGWHAGCLVRDTCAGTATDLPWAIGLGESAIGRHPVELYAAALLVIGAIVLNRLEVGVGRVGALALIWTAGARLVTEPLRLSLGSDRVFVYLAGVVVGIGVYAVAGRSAPPESV